MELAQGDGRGRRPVCYDRQTRSRSREEAALSTRRLSRRAARFARGARKALWALAHRHHPVLVHLVATRRCNLSCAYCNEYDTSSPPVALPLLLARLDKLGELGTAVVTVTGGEPFLHPELDEVLRHARRRGMMTSVITNGYHLSRERIDRLNAAGLDWLQISIDNVEPDRASMKSLRLLEPRLRWLAERAEFGVNVNSVIGAGIERPEDALAVARRARSLGFTSSLGIVHDGRGQLRPLDSQERAVYRRLRSLGSRGDTRVNALFQDNLARARPNRWRCRAGARYLYVDEEGLVSYCSQRRDAPGIPLASYTRADLAREYLAPKACAPYCTVNCAQRVALFDNWRAPQGAGGEAGLAEPLAGWR